MKVSFYLRKEKINKDGLIPIAFIISGDGLIFRKNIKNVKSKLVDWDFQKERIKAKKNQNVYNFHIEHNKKIDELEFKLKELFRYLQLNDNLLTKDLILEKLKDGAMLKNTISFFECFDEFIKLNKPTKAERTIKGYKTAKNS